MLVRKPSGYYLHVTCYLLKEHFKKEHIAEAVGIDFGVSNKIILSNGLAIDFELRKTRRLKKLHRKLSRVKSGKVHKLSFSDRAMRCDCGWVCDRDLNAALVVLKKGLELSEQYFVGLDRPEVKLLEKGAAARMDIGLKPTYSCKLASMKEEAHSLKGMRGGHLPQYSSELFG